MSNSVKERETRAGVFAIVEKDNDAGLRWTAVTIENGDRDKPAAPASPWQNGYADG